MKKILISILIILILILVYVGFTKGINIGFIKINSIENVKLAKIALDEDFNRANTLANVTYMQEIENLETAITKLKSIKQDYQNKNLNNEQNEAITNVQVKTYTIHYLWTVLGNYSKDRSLKPITIDLKAGQGENIYDLEFTLVGKYVGITDFIYDIENDEELNFKIENLKISSQIGKISNNKVNNNEGNSQNTSNTSEESAVTNDVQNSDGNIIQATFTVKNVGITLE